MRGIAQREQCEANRSDRDDSETSVSTEGW